MPSSESGPSRQSCVRQPSVAAASAGDAYRYQARLTPTASGSLIYGVRVVPHHPGLSHPYDMGLARWA